jgi:hypothetical protein
MPYQSQVLRRFLRIARNVDWSKPLSLTVFKGKDSDGKDETGIWFQQNGATVKAFYSRESPHGMPAATQDPDTHEWDFKPQHRWLIQRLQDEIMPEIERAAAHAAPPIEPAHGDEAPPAPDSAPDWGEPPITDDDVPF